jgi:threonine/homoserine/homoserine lactone efflux protein
MSQTLKESPFVVRALYAVGATILLFLAIGPVLADKEEGMLGVVSAVSWFGLFVLVPVFAVLAAIAAARRLRARSS